MKKQMKRTVYEAPVTLRAIADDCVYRILFLHHKAIVDDHQAYTQAETQRADEAPQIPLHTQKIACNKHYQGQQIQNSGGFQHRACLRFHGNQCAGLCTDGVAGGKDHGLLHRAAAGTFMTIAGTCALPHIGYLRCAVRITCQYFNQLLHRVPQSAALPLPGIP